MTFTVVRTMYHPEPTYETRHGAYVTYTSDNEAKEAWQWGYDNFGYYPNYAMDQSRFEGKYSYYWFKTERELTMFLLRWG